MTSKTCWQANSPASAQFACSLRWANYVRHRMWTPISSLVALVGGGTAPRCMVICTVLQRGFLLAHPFSARPLLIEPHVTKIPFRIVDVPGKGKGLIATRPIAQGTKFFHEPPLYVGKKELHPIQWMELGGIVEKFMDPRALAILDDLANCRPVEGKFASPRVEKIRTNAFGVELYPADITMQAVFQVLSRANHCCDPNASFGWSLCVLLPARRCM